MAATTSQREVSRRICYIFLCTSQVSKIGRTTLRDGTRLLWIFQTVAMAEYFRDPRNSITTALHYGKFQWVFNFQVRKLSSVLLGILTEQAAILLKEVHVISTACGMAIFVVRSFVSVS